MNIDLISIPISYRCDRVGPQYGPSKLGENHIIDIITNLEEHVFEVIK